MSTTVTAAHTLPAGQPISSYGVDNPILADLLERTATDVPSVEVIEVFDQSLLPAGNGKSSSPKHLVASKTYSDFETLKNFLDAEVPKEQTLRMLTVTKLSGPVLQLLGYLADPPERPRIFVLRRIAGHLRHDNNLWTFIFFADPYLDISSANYISDIPGGAVSPFSVWLSEYVKDTTPQQLLDDLGGDGFGLVLQVLRNVKTSWKLLLNEMEVFMGVLAEDYSNDELVASTTWLQRRFIMNLDYCSLQLLYHQRFITYLTNAPLQKGLCIAPVMYKCDLLQEKDALVVAVQRLKDIRDRTTSILETVLNLHAAHQAKLASEMTALQRQDAAIAVLQNDAIRRLTFVNMAYLPPSFIAAVYGMNIAQNGTDPGSWSLWGFLGVATFLTIGTLIVATVLSSLRPEPYMVPEADPAPKAWFDFAFPRRTGASTVYIKFQSLLGKRRKKTLEGIDLV
ncbi:hypothetical protein DL98DRAFT_589352 [Cadophora sp. DSE1049]|nr:hypothetical protein DL98DRAFT_589352 [Cadophora sp. DSE1049]